MFKRHPSNSANDRTPRPNRRDGDRQLIKLLSQPLILEEFGPPRLLTQMTQVISLLIVGLIAWAAVAEIRETALAQGQVIPAGSVLKVQHLEGGIVADILVDDGDIVDRGQLLIRLESASAQAELEQLRAREAALALRAERLRAFVVGRVADFAAGSAHPELAADQQAILDMQTEARASQRKVLEARIDQKQAQAAALIGQRKSLERQVQILEEELEMRSELLKKGLMSRVVYLETERTLNRTRGELASIEGEAAKTTAAIREAEDSLEEMDLGLRNDALKEMGEVTGELAQVREQLAKLRDRVARLAIVAPARGVVQGLIAKTVGGVVPPGETVMEIVPLDEILVAEVRISPRDVGHLRVGQEADVKITTYDVARFGSVEGRLQQISATTFEDDEGDPYYRGIIALASDHVGKDPEANLIVPGMVVDVAIDTGSKSVMQYLLKPVYRGFNGAFSER
ncbi:MAG TPA: HlyD family type I secretion periplasmic adaptor subunit [Kiloniellales bacterium]